MPPEALAVVDLWDACRQAGGLHGRATAFVGGALEQPAALIDAFALLDGFAAQGGGRE